MVPNFWAFVRREGGSCWGEGRPLFHYSRASTIQPPDFEKSFCTDLTFFYSVALSGQKIGPAWGIVFKEMTFFFWPFTRETVF